MMYGQVHSELLDVPQQQADVSFRFLDQRFAPALPLAVYLWLDFRLAKQRFQLVGQQGR